MKNLGLYFDRYMTFENHVNEITKKAMGALMFINRNKENFNIETRKTIVQSLVLSILNYGNTIWGTNNDTLIMKVQKLQNFAIKVADGRARKFDHVTPLFKAFQWLKIKDQIKFSIIATIFKQLSNYYPDNILSLPSVNTMTNSNTRQQNNLYVPKVNTDIGGRALTVLGPKLWNELPVLTTNSEL